MADYDPDEERAWSEYDWERFLQQQDKRTEKYMDLLERYLDHPQRDQIIAAEMGWTHLTHSEEEWLEEAELTESDEEAVAADEETFQHNELYQAAFALTVWIDKMFDRNEALQNEPAAVKLATHSALASAKLAAALSNDDGDEIGMTIAYLKRALKAITTALEGAAQLREQRLITPRQLNAVDERLFQVRDGIVTLMGQYRGEWLRRFGRL
jgi:hypothetical protein